MLLNILKTPLSPLCTISYFITPAFSYNILKIIAMHKVFRTDEKWGSEEE